MWASNVRVTRGTSCGWTSMSPRLTSISSSRRSVTDSGTKASSRSPPKTSIALTWLVLPDGRTMIGSPLRTTPEAIRPANPR